MGADLSVMRGKEEMAYFRDSYNASNLLWQLGGSYWEMLKSCKSHKAKIEYLKECLKRLPLKQQEWAEMLKPEWAEHFNRKTIEFENWIREADRSYKKRGVKIIWSC